MTASRSALTTEPAKRQALERELAVRRRIYPVMVDSGLMTEAEARHGIWILERVLAEGYTPS